jgi:AcrR family transcriptional regulator
MAGEQLSGKAATQERILAAATELFLTKGYEQTTVAEVAELGGVSRATVFWHFSDKASLFREAFNRLVEPLRESLERSFDDLEPEKRLQEQIAIYRSYTVQHRVALEGFIRWAIEAPVFREWLITTLLDMHQRFAGVLIETISELTPPENDASAIATGLMVLLDGDVFLSWFDTSSRRSDERMRAVETYLAMIPRRSPVAN